MVSPITLKHHVILLTQVNSLCVQLTCEKIYIYICVCVCAYKYESPPLSLYLLSQTEKQEHREEKGKRIFEINGSRKGKW